MKIILKNEDAIAYITKCPSTILERSTQHLHERGPGPGLECSARYGLPRRDVREGRERRRRCEPRRFLRLAREVLPSVVEEVAAADHVWMFSRTSTSRAHHRNDSHLTHPAN
jgi:hypothetical protein